MLKAFVQLEIGRLESGLFILEVVTGIAPLIGLLGTVFGLTSVFGTFSPELEFSDPSSFVSGIALALNTTILGLLIAIPSLAMYAFFQRRIDVISHQLDLSIESLLYQDRVE
jgi:biopolymer transport protein ExbB